MKTSVQVVERELLLKLGDPFDSELWQESVQRIKNLQIFSSVETSYQNTPEGEKLEIILKEKWTLIPIMKFGSGGGVQSYTLGAYNVNSFGQYLELGGQYENLGGRNNGVMWFRKPRLLDSYWKLSGDAWDSLRGVTLFDSEGEKSGSYILSRKKLNVSLEKELSPIWTFGFGFEHNQESFLEDMLSIEDQRSNQLNSAMFSETMIVNQPRAWLSLGRLNYENHLVFGHRLTLTQEYLFFWHKQFERRTMELLYFKRLPSTLNLGFRYNLTETSSDYLHHHSEAGGFREVRGYQDARFRSPSIHFFNLDFRKDVYSSSKYFLQGILFADGGSAAEKAGLLFSTAQDFYALGVGIRVIVPSVYRLNVRLDAALATSEKNPSPISVGLQQFF